MKKAAALFLALCLAVLICGGPGASAAYDHEYGSQDAFLRDMAEGITLRQEAGGGSSEMTVEELAQHYLKLVGCELDKIEKYLDQTFEDQTFNRLAHMYIYGCQIQRFAAENYKNSALFKTLWDSGYNTCAAIITELYTRYELPITAEQAAGYAPTTSYSSTDPTGGPDRTDYSDQLEVRQLPDWNNSYSYHHDLIVTNKSADCSLTVAASAVFYDEEDNVIGTCKTTLFALGKGESQYCELYTSTPFARAEARVDQASNDGFIVSGLSELTFNVTTPNGKIIVEATNTGTETISWGEVYCVFYSGDDVVDVDFDIFASVSDQLKPGETQYGECSTRKEFTRYELYYYTYIEK